MDSERDIETRATPEAISVDRQQMLGEAVLVAVAFQGGIEYPSDEPEACLDLIQGALAEERQQDLTAQLTAMYPDESDQPARLFRFILQSEITNPPGETASHEPWLEIATTKEKQKLGLTEAGHRKMADIYQRVTNQDKQAIDLFDEVIQRTAPEDN